MQSTFQWRLLVLEASVGELLLLWLLLFLGRHNFVPARGGRPINCRKYYLPPLQAFLASFTQHEVNEE